MLTLLYKSKYKHKGSYTYRNTHIYEYTHVCLPYDQLNETKSEDIEINKVTVDGHVPCHRKNSVVNFLYESRKM